MAKNIELVPPEFGKNYMLNPSYSSSYNLNNSGTTSTLIPPIPCECFFPLFLCQYIYNLMYIYIYIKFWKKLQRVAFPEFDIASGKERYVCLTGNDD